MNKIEQHLTNVKEFWDKGKAQIDWDDLSNFEKSYRYNFKVNEIKARLEYLHEWRLNIGKEVYLSRDSWNYTLVDEFYELDQHNRNSFDNSFSTMFTEEMFDSLCRCYIIYSIDYLVRDFLERDITRNSTCKLSNLVFEWQLDCKQDLIKEFKNALK